MRSRTHGLATCERPLGTDPADAAATPKVRHAGQGNRGWSYRDPVRHPVRGAHVPVHYAFVRRAHIHGQDRPSTPTPWTVHQPPAPAGTPALAQMRQDARRIGEETAVNYRHLRGGGLRLPSGTSAAWCRSRLSSLPCLAAWRGGVCVGVVDCTLRARIMFGRDRIAWY